MDRDPCFEPFDGKSISWPYYLAQLLTTSNKRDYGDILLGNTVSASKVVSTAARAILAANRTQIENEAIKTYDTNSNAYTGLLLTISPKTDTGKVAFSIVENVKSAYLPDGNMKAAYDQLEARYIPKHDPTLVSLEKHFRECYLKVGRDPLNWITILQTIAMNTNRIVVAGKSNKTAQDTAIHISATAPKEYETAVETVDKTLKENPASIDLEDIKTLFQNRYTHLKKYKSLKCNESNTALAALEALSGEKAFAGA